MNTTETKEVTVFLSKRSVGRGHYRLSLNLDERELSWLTTNTRLIDRLNTGLDGIGSDDEFEDNKAATIEAIEYVLDQNSINYSSVETSQSHKYGTIYSVIYYPSESE